MSFCKDIVILFCYVVDKDFYFVVIGVFWVAAVWPKFDILVCRYGSVAYSSK